MPYFVIVRGPLGSGKTTVSAKLAEELKAEHIKIDEILDEHNLGADQEEGFVSQESFYKANDIACEEVEKLLAAGLPVIFDGNFYWLSQIKHLKERLPHPCHVFTLVASLETCIERDKMREDPHGERAAEVVYDKTMSFKTGIEIDATKPVEDIVQDILSHIPSAV